MKHVSVIAVIAPPAYAAVSLEDAKAHLRVDHADDDALIEGYVEAATQMIDGPAGWLGRALIDQVLELRLSCFGNCDIRLPYPPLGQVVSVKYDDGDGIERAVDPSVYRTIGSPSAPRIAPAYGRSWPAARWQAEAVRIRYKAGYGTYSDGVPAPIRTAILMLVAEFYDAREAASDRPRSELPFAVTALLSTFRVFHL